jgi:hypothetical protein
MNLNRVLLLFLFKYFVLLFFLCLIFSKIPSQRNLFVDNVFYNIVSFIRCFDFIYIYYPQNRFFYFVTLYNTFYFFMLVLTIIFPYINCKKKTIYINVTNKISFIHSKSNKLRLKSRFPNLTRNLLEKIINSI